MTPNKRETLLDWMADPAGPLAAITTANGYSNTVALLQRGQRALPDLTDADYPALFIAGTKERRKLITVNQFRADLEVEILGAVKSPDGVSGAQMQLDKLISDVTKALETDRLQGGRCTLTTITDIETDRGDLEPHAVFSLMVTFLYHTEGTVP